MSHTLAGQLGVIRHIDCFSRGAAWMAGNPSAHTNGRLPGDRRSLHQAIAPASAGAGTGAPDLRVSHPLSHLLDPQLADTSQSTAVSPTVGETEFVEQAIARRVELAFRTQRNGDEYRDRREGYPKAIGQCHVALVPRRRKPQTLIAQKSPRGGRASVVAARLRRVVVHDATAYGPPSGSDWRMSSISPDQEG